MGDMMREYAVFLPGLLDTRASAVIINELRAFFILMATHRATRWHNGLLVEFILRSFALGSKVGLRKLGVIAGLFLSAILE